MTRIPPPTLPILMLSVMSSTDHGSQAPYTIYGRVTDEKGDYVNGADVTVESAVDRRHIVTAWDGNFYTDICIGGFYDEVVVKALFGLKQGSQRISARGSHIPVDIVIKERKLE